MELYFRKSGKGPPVVILHGLYGSSDNWMTIARMLEKEFELFIPDQRNHGKSPHSKEFNYTLLTQDVVDFFSQQQITKAVIIGHSMGGKVAMHVARKFPELVSSLILVDIAPKNYYSDLNEESLAHVSILEALQKLYLPSITSRDEADHLLSYDLKDEKLRSFLLKNLKRTGDRKFEWLLNLHAIKENFSEISEGFLASDWDNIQIEGFPVLFIKGEKSNYISKEDIPVIKRIFPAADLIEIPETGHWLHAEKPAEFAKTVNDFIFG
jgi:pimeloyl-ACP methyl ester carboxylesterase